MTADEAALATVEHPFNRSWFDGDGDPWVIVDHMFGDALRRTHYFCRACCADLTDLRVHHVVCCPYCGAELPYLLEGARPRVKWDGPWPYDLMQGRFGAAACTWHTVVPGTPPTQEPNGTQSWPMTSCRRLGGHSGECRFTGERERPPRNPVRGTG